MHYDQRSIWEPMSIRVGLEPDEDHQQREKYRKRKRSTCCPWCSWCCGPTIAGLLIGMLVAGTVLAVFLTFYLRKEGSNITCATMATNAPSTTVTSTTVTSTTTSVTETTTSSTKSTTTTQALNVNLVVNGDGETGPCSMNSSTVSPTGWSFSGPITQNAYNNTIMVHQTNSDPGPSDRGRCYFIGKTTASTSMWQTIDLTNKVNPLLIDSQTIRYNLSAWMGGYFNQDDNAVVSLTFIDSNNQLVDNSTNLGPVLANDRGNQTSLIYQQTDGLVPVGTRSMVLCVTLNRMNGGNNNGDIDNIALVLY